MYSYAQCVNMYLSPTVYEAGSVFDPSILDITDEDILKRFVEVRRTNHKIFHMQFILDAV